LSGWALLTLLIRCRDYEFFCLFCFLKWQNWQLTAIAAIFSNVDAAWKRLYNLVKRIPKGRVVTYGQLARATRLPGGARAAGRAMAACPLGQAIPWHRVVAAGGRIAVREPFGSLQRRLLESEGARFVERRVAAECIWAPPRPGVSRPKVTARNSRSRRRPKPQRHRTRK
jgi:methylated-DNA-protein-cysteine methyltransferase related protein